MGLLGKLWGKSDAGDVSFAQVTDATFKGVLETTEKPIMLFLWSSTCPYCRKMAVNVKNVLARHGDAVVGMHANASEAPAISSGLDLRGVPATAFFHRGKLVELVGGFRPEDYLEQIIATHFPPAQPPD